MPPSGDAPKPYNASKARHGPRHVAGTRGSAGKRTAAKPSHYLSTAEARALCDHLDTKLPPMKNRKTFQSLSFKKFEKRAE